MSWLYHAKVTVIPIVKYEIKTFRAHWGVEKHKDIKIPRCSNKTCIASNFLDTVIILHTTAHIKFWIFWFSNLATLYSVGQVHDPLLFFVTPVKFLSILLKHFHSLYSSRHFLKH